MAQRPQLRVAKNKDGAALQLRQPHRRVWAASTQHHRCWLHVTPDRLHEGIARRVGVQVQLLQGLLKCTAQTGKQVQGSVAGTKRTHGTPAQVRGLQLMATLLTTGGCRSAVQPRPSDMPGRHMCSTSSRAAAGMRKSVAGWNLQGAGCRDIAGREVGQCGITCASQGHLNATQKGNQLVPGKQRRAASFSTNQARLTCAGLGTERVPAGWAVSPATHMYTQ